MMIPWRTSVCLLLSLPTACGGSTSSDPPSEQQGGRGNAGGASAAGGSAGSGGAASGRSLEAPCFNPQGVTMRCADFGRVEQEKLLDAAMVAPGARFTALGGWAALLEMPENANQRLVVVSLPGEPRDGQTRLLEMERSDAAGELRVRSVWTLHHGSSSFALACNAARCRLLVARYGEGVLRPLAAFDLPASFAEGELVGSSERLCVYGDGARCMGPDGWIEAVPASAGTIVAMTLTTRTAAAISATGTLFLESDSGWLPQSERVPLAISAHAYDGVLTVLAEDGAWYSTVLGTSASTTCLQPAPLRLATVSPWLVLDAAGTVYRQDSVSKEWCELTSANGASFLAVGFISHCAQPANILAISDESLFSLVGPVVCVLTK